MGKDAKISVIIPTFNGGNSIIACLTSVLDQTYQPWEVIVVDDGSTDGTSEIIRRMQNSRIKYVYQKNSGAGSARNTGIRIATGNWIAFLDSDDEWMPNKLQAQVRLIDNHPKMDFVHSNRKHRWTGGKEDMGRIGLAPSEFMDKEFLLKHWVVKLSTVMISKRLLNRLGYYFVTHLKTCEDYELLWRAIILADQIGYIEDLLARIVISDESLSRKGEPCQFRFDNITAMGSVIDWITLNFWERAKNRYLDILRARQKSEFYHIFSIRLSNLQVGLLFRDFANCARTLSLSKATRAFLAAIKTILAVRLIS